MHHAKHASREAFISQGRGLVPRRRAATVLAGSSGAYSACAPCAEYSRAARLQASVTATTHRTASQLRCCHPLGSHKAAVHLDLSIAGVLPKVIRTDRKAAVRLPNAALAYRVCCAHRMALGVDVGRSIDRGMWRAKRGERDIFDPCAALAFDCQRAALRHHKQ